MMSKEEIELRARFAAIEYLVTRLYERQIRENFPTDPQDALKRLRHNWLSGLEKETVAGVPAEESDHLTAEVRDAIDRLLRMVGELLQSKPR